MLYLRNSKNLHEMCIIHFSIFGLMAMCFLLLLFAKDCESIQYASALVRDGNSLLVGYGVEDCDSFLQRFDLDEVMQSLLNIADL